MDIKEIGQLSQAKLAAPKKPGQDNGFKQILQGTLSGLSEPTSDNPMGVKANVVAQGEKVLDLLDIYARELKDSTKTLKDMAPLMEDIQKEVGLLDGKGAEVIKDDHELSSLLNDLTLTANIAVLKFQRGDFI